MSNSAKVAPDTSKSIPIKSNYKNKDDHIDEDFKTPPTSSFLLEQHQQQDKVVKFAPNEVTIIPNNKSNEEDDEEKPEKMEDIVLSNEDVFVNLTLISKIEVGDKLVRNKADKLLNIDTTYFQFLTRWFRGNNRNNSLKFISLVLVKAFEINDKLLSDKTANTAQQLFRLTSDLKNCLNGLNNLKQTYSYDKLIQSEIDVMIDNIRLKLDYNSKNLHF